MKRSEKPLNIPKDGLLKNTPSRIGRVLKQNTIKDSDNSTRKVEIKIKGGDEK